MCRYNLKKNKLDDCAKRQKKHLCQLLFIYMRNSNSNKESEMQKWTSNKGSVQFCACRFKIRYIDPEFKKEKKKKKK